MGAAHLLISTVGASLITGPASASSNARFMTSFERGDYGQAAAELARCRRADERECGAEINTISELMHRNLIEADAALSFFVSQTAVGEQVGKVLKAFYEQRGHRVDVYEIAGLQDQDENRFRRDGLRNLVQEIGRRVRNAGGPECVAINATGGYKAEMALAAVIGQALQVPVYYKHERFPGVIALPPMPISFDFGLMAESAALLDEIDQARQVRVDHESDVPRSLLPLLEVEDVDGETWVALSPVGQTYIEGYRLRYPAEATLPAAATSRRAPTFRDDHYPDGFREWVNGIFARSEYVTGCHSLPYHGQRAIRDRVFKIRDNDCGEKEIVGEYNPNGFGGRVAILTTARTDAERTAVIMDMTARFGRTPT